MYHSRVWSFFEDFCTYLCSKSAQRRKTSRMQAAFCKIYNEPRRIFTFLQPRIVHTFNISDFDTIDVEITIFRGFLSSSTKEFFHCRSNQMLLKFRKTFPEGHWKIGFEAGNILIFHLAVAGAADKALHMGAPAGECTHTTTCAWARAGKCICTRWTHLLNIT